MQKLADVEMSWGDRLRTEGRTEGRSEGRSEGRTEGIKAGKVQAQQQTLLHLLDWRFKLSESEKEIYVQRLAAIDDLPALAQLLDHVLTLPTLAEFATKLLAYQPIDTTVEEEI